MWASPLLGQLFVSHLLELLLIIFIRKLFCVIVLIHYLFFVALFFLLIFFLFLFLCLLLLLFAIFLSLFTIILQFLIFCSAEFVEVRPSHILHFLELSILVYNIALVFQEGEHKFTACANRGVTIGGHEPPEFVICTLCILIAADARLLLLDNLIDRWDIA